MANQYQKIALATRKKVSKLTLEQQKQMLKLYEDTIDSLATKISISKDKSLSQRWLTDYQKELNSVRKTLAKDIESSTKNAISKAAKIGTETEQLIFKEVFKIAGIDPGNHFTTMFSQVQNQVVENIISGNLYKDKKTLSQRIWNHSGKFEKDIQYIINQGILEKKSALELARDLEQFVREPAKRGSNWGKAYPNLRNTPVDYNSMRLARTTINHSYQNSSIQSSNMNPFVEGIEWHSAQIHGRTCELCFERHGQIFPKDSVPLDHPNGLCTMLPYVPKDLNTVADELRDWLDGENNPMLDDWYDEYGDYFAFGRSGYNSSSKGKIYDIIDSQGSNPFTELYKEWNGTNVKDFATKLIEHEQLPLKVNRHKISGAHGQCMLNYKGSRMQIKTYELNSADARDIEYQIKTAFHELFHAKSNGLIHDIGKISFSDWAYVDDIFAEVTSHYLTRSIGITREITPSYPEHLVDALPKLKKLPKFSSCNTIADFGEVAYKYRFSEDATAEWKTMLDTLNNTKHDPRDYSKHYIKYVEENKDDLIDKILENTPQLESYKNDISRYIDSGITSTNKGFRISDEAQYFLDRALIITMNRLGVK